VASRDSSMGGDAPGVLPGGIGLSVVVPMYREEVRIGRTLGDLVPSLERGVPGLDGASELILVDDGSEDGTKAAVEPWIREAASGRLARVRLVRHGANRGKGAGVRTGLLASEGRWRLIMDADNSCRVDQVAGLLAVALDSGAALVAGSRRAPGAVVSASVGRRITGWAFQGALSALGMRLLSDTQCGFKLYRADAAEWIARRAREDGWCFDLEHLMLARRGGFGIAEVGVVWDHREGSNVRALRDGLAMVWRAGALRARGVRTDAPASEWEPKPGPSAPAGAPSPATIPQEMV